MQLTLHPVSRKTQPGSELTGSTWGFTGMRPEQVAKLSTCHLHLARLRVAGTSAQQPRELDIPGLQPEITEQETSHSHPTSPQGTRVQSRVAEKGHTFLEEQKPGVRVQ